VRPFALRHVDTVADAVGCAVATGGSYYAGGTNMLDLMKNRVVAPEVLIDVRRLGLDGISATADGGVLIGAGATNSAVANHRLVRSQYPVLSHAILSGATTQLRNMATVGGNLLQRTRCPYYMDSAFAACDKRNPGSGCGARAGFHREHAVFGTSSCVAVHPSDMAVALTILDARIHVAGPAGAREISIADLYRMPGDSPHRDTTLEPAELIVAVEIPPSRYAARSWYLKVRDRHSYAFALVSVAAGLDVVDGIVRRAAIAIGGVAATPWRVRLAEIAVEGIQPGEASFRRAARLLMAGSEPLPGNAFKVDLAKHAVVAALERAAALP
jgi:xanthine dehydrogenase YagS FAD-binding subunit